MLREGSASDSHHQSTPNEPPPGLRADFPRADKVTFTSPHSARGSPLNRFKASTSNAPAPDPYRFIHAKLGLTAEEFQERTRTDVDEFLAEIDEERRQVLRESQPFERILSKEECLLMFRDERPNTGPLIGIHSWAADLGHTRFNFDWDWDKDDINLLNAYD